MSNAENGSTLEPEERALKIMKQDVGVWDCRWEFLDDEGGTSATAHGTQTMSFVIENSVMQVMMDVPEMETQSVTHRFFDPLPKTILDFS